MSTDPPIDNADPAEEHRYLLCYALERLANGEPASPEHIRQVAGEARQEIKDLEKLIYSG